MCVFHRFFLVFFFFFGFCVLCMYGYVYVYVYVCVSVCFGECICECVCVYVCVHVIKYNLKVNYGLAVYVIYTETTSKDTCNTANISVFVDLHENNTTHEKHKNICLSIKM